ncbi:MAG: hypothetical protein GY726_10730 [Proteobacteria bacterium]|nr:hypothetical protein [Pseudomonadota bacterium]
MSEHTASDRTAIFGVIFFMANVLFVIFGGIFYLALWVLLVRRYKKSSPLAQNHLKQALIAASLTTIIFIILNIFILSTGGYVPLSRSAILAIELYGIVVLPLFMGLGVYALSKAIRHEEIRYPLIGRLV